MPIGSLIDTVRNVVDRQDTAERIDVLASAIVGGWLGHAADAHRAGRLRDVDFIDHAHQAAAALRYAHQKAQNKRRKEHHV